MRGEIRATALTSEDRLTAIVREFQELKRRLMALEADALSALDGDTVRSELALQPDVFLTGATQAGQDYDVVHGATPLADRVVDAGVVPGMFEVEGLGDLVDLWNTSFGYTLSTTGASKTAAPFTGRSRRQLRPKSAEGNESAIEERLLEAAEAFRGATFALLATTNQAVEDIREQRELTRDLLGKLEAKLGEIDGGR